MKKLAAFGGIILTGCFSLHEVNNKEGNLIKNSRNNITTNIFQNNTVNIDKNKDFIRTKIGQIKYYSKYLIQESIMYNELENKANTNELTEEELQYMKELKRQISYTQTLIKFYDECIKIAQEEITIGKPLSEKTKALLKQQEYQILFSKKEESINIQ